MTPVPIEERLALQDITYRYCLYCDTRQIEKQAALFTEDGVLDESCVGMAPVKGPAGIIAFSETKAARSVTHMVHYVTNHVISEYDGTNASGLCYVHYIGTLKNGAQIQIYGYYDDRYRKVNGEWRIASRVLKQLIAPSGMPLLGEITYDTEAKHFA